MRAFLTALLSTVPLLLMVTTGAAHPLDDKCTQLSHKYREEQRSVKLPPGFAIDDTLMQFDAFYSPTLDACIQTEIADIGVYYYIRDLTRSLLADMEWGMNLLLNCSRDGTNSVIIEEVKQHRGYVFHVPYEEWLDDGYGGPPATLKSPDKPYTKADCQKIFDKWMSMLK